MILERPRFIDYSQLPYKSINCYCYYFLEDDQNQHFYVIIAPDGEVFGVFTLTSLKVIVSAMCLKQFLGALESIQKLSASGASIIMLTMARMNPNLTPIGHFWIQICIKKGEHKRPC